MFLVQVRLIVVWFVVFIATWMIALLYATQQAWKLLEEPRRIVVKVVRKL